MNNKLVGFCLALMYVFGGLAWCQPASAFFSAKSSTQQQLVSGDWVPPNATIIVEGVETTLTHQLEYQWFDCQQENKYTSITLPASIQGEESTSCLGTTLSQYPITSIIGLRYQLQSQNDYEQHHLPQLVLKLNDEEIGWLSEQTTSDTWLYISLPKELRENYQSTLSIRQVGDGIWSNQATFTLLEFRASVVVLRSDETLTFHFNEPAQIELFLTETQEQIVQTESFQQEYVLDTNLLPREGTLTVRLVDEQNNQSNELYFSFIISTDNFPVPQLLWSHYGEDMLTVSVTHQSDLETSYIGLNQYLLACSSCAEPIVGTIQMPLLKDITSLWHSRNSVVTVAFPVPKESHAGRIYSHNAFRIPSAASQLIYW